MTEPLPWQGHFFLLGEPGLNSRGDHMSTLRTVTLAVVFIAGTTSLTMAQNSPGGTNASNAMPPSGYLGPGAYPSYNAANFQRPANAKNDMPPSGYLGPAAYPSYNSANFQRPANAKNDMPPSGYLGPAAYPSYKSSNFQAANPAPSGGRPLYRHGRHRTVQRAASRQ
jgi:hypothetical protein